MFYKNLLILVAAIVAVCSSAPFANNVNLNGANHGNINNHGNGDYGMVQHFSYPSGSMTNYLRGGHELRYMGANGANVQMSN